jgi:hypothetical protein
VILAHDQHWTVRVVHALGRDRTHDEAHETTNASRTDDEQTASLLASMRTSEGLPGTANHSTSTPSVDGADDQTLEQFSGVVLDLLVVVLAGRARQAEAMAA